jgi:hypothetical protein
LAIDFKGLLFAQSSVNQLGGKSMNNPLLIVLVTMVLTWLNFGAVATPSQQRRQTKSAVAGLALEVTYYQGRPPSYQKVIGSTSFALFRRVPSWTTPAGTFPVRGVGIDRRLEGDAVRIEVSVVSGVRSEEKITLVSTHLIRENEKITISELTRFGVEPFEVKVVRVTNSLAIQPLINSQAGSIAIVGIDPRKTTLPSYKISLQNLSSQNVMALGVEVLVNGQKRGITMPQGKEGRPLIAPGAVYELIASGATDALLTSEGYRPYSHPIQGIVITAAMFEDNSFEGDPKTAALFRASKIGRKIQVARLLPLIQAGADPTESDVSAAANRLQAQVSSLSYDVETSVVDRLLEDFPTLGADGRERLKKGIEAGLRQVKNELLRDLQKFVNPRSQSLDAQTFQTWLRANKEKYEKWLARL